MTVTLAAQDRDSLQLDHADAAIVFKTDGTCVVSFPQTDAGVMPDNILTGAAVIYALRNEKLLSLIRENFDLECKRMADQAAANNGAVPLAVVTGSAQPQKQAKAQTPSKKTAS